MRRGEIWWVDMPDPEGSGPGFRRPILVVQANSFNQSRIQTVVCVVLTSNTRLSDMPGNVLLDQSDSGLPKESVANVSQVVTLDRRFLSELVGSVPELELTRVDEGLKLVLDL